MARCPAHGNRIQLNPSGAVNLFGATPQPDCRWIFGNPFGLALYDKQQREVTSSAAPTPVASANPSSRPAEVVPGRQLQSPAQPEVDPSLDPLDPGTIHQLHSTIRSLPRPALEGLTKAFRKRFQVPPDAPSIADRISQRRHHEWIEAFLVQHQQLVA
jgi:hypothetical protein